MVSTHYLLAHSPSLNLTLNSHNNKQIISHLSQEELNYPSKQRLQTMHSIIMWGGKKEKKKKMKVVDQRQKIVFCRAAASLPSWACVPSDIWIRAFSFLLNRIFTLITSPYTPKEEGEKHHNASPANATRIMPKPGATQSITATTTI